MEKTMLRKGFVPQKIGADAKERSRVVRITTGAVDRDGEIVRPDGGQFDQYLLNPVVLFAHDYNSMPVGKCVSLKTDDKGVVAKTVYNNTEAANEIYQAVADGFPLAVSIGFISVESSYAGESGFQAQLDDCVRRGWVTPAEARTVRRIYTKWVLLEYSDVPVPSNPEALQLAISKGWVKPNNKNSYERSEMDKPNGKSGAVLSAENITQLRGALGHHAEVGKCLKAVLANAGADAGDGSGAAGGNDNDGDEAEGKSVTADKFREILTKGMTELVAHRVKTAGNELWTMVARATGKHIEL